MEEIEIPYLYSTFSDFNREFHLSAWYGHIPFASWLVSLLKPQTIVELGTHYGISYHAFCEAIIKNNLRAKAYAIDTWKGDFHAGHYGEEVYLNFKNYHDQHYSSFSTLMRMTFNEAVNNFSDQFIDLLHIDGLHTYEAVKHDFETWLPKLSKKGVVLFHDTCVTENDFGVYQLWKELTTQYPSFNFTHSYGLGVLLVGQERHHYLEKVASLENFQASTFNQLFQKLGDNHEKAYLLDKNQLELQEQKKIVENNQNLIQQQTALLHEIEIQLRQKEEEFLQQKELAEQQQALLSETKDQLYKQEVLISEKNIFLAEQEKVLLEKEKVIVEQKNAISEKENLITQKDTLLQEKENQLIKNKEAMMKLKNRRLVQLIKIESLMQRIKEILQRRLMAYRIGRSKLFDRQWYLKQNPDVKKAEVDPILHYIHAGAAEVRDPSSLFNTNYYLNNNPDVAASGINPLYHYIQFGWREGRLLDQTVGIVDSFCKDGNNKNFWKTFIYSIFNKMKMLVQKRPLLQAVYQHLNEAKEDKRGGLFSKELEVITRDEITSDVRLIALYLPQYHTIKENNIWWGEGFTEWTNVKRGVPFYKRHYQPHVPHDDIGYYNLEDEAVLEKQAKLAREYGIHGFCFYYYWFGGRRLLEKPIDRLLKSGKPNFPFCFCWANENWTRTWDGGDHEVLMEQKYSLENDEAIIRDLIPFFKDSRYIRVDGKPLFVIYRPSSLPDMKATAERWRQICREEGVGEIYLGAMRAFELINPLKYGLDAVIQFPPLNVSVQNLALNSKLEVDSSFHGSILSMDQARKHYIKEKTKYPLIRSVCPSWDNTARRMERATSWIGATPKAYYDWLCQAIIQTRASFEEGKRMIFINAWNEWGEGCHLEPDQKFGYAWLNATRKALGETNKKDNPYILIISHDAALAGAQILTLNILKEWSKMQGVRFKIICVQGGVLLDDFKKLGITLSLENYKTSQEQDDILKNFITPGIQGIYSSTVVNGPLLARLRYLKVPIITHAHELQKAIERWAPGEIIKATIENSDLILAASPQIIDNLEKRHGVSKSKMKLLLASIPLVNKNAISSKKEQFYFKNEINLNPEDIVVLGSGTTDWRKGTDLFLKTAVQACRLNGNLKFIWIGGSPEKYRQEVKKNKLENRIWFLPHQKDSRKYYQFGDIFFLSSREDPCPLVALEAADASLPIVCFENAGYIPDLVKEDAGIVVPYEDITPAVEAIICLANNPERRQSFGKIGRERVAKDHSSNSAAAKILEYFQEECKKRHKNKNLEKKEEPLVSVIVPNYNHAPFLEDRLKTIAEQTYQNIEIIVLDDCSSDSSSEVIKKFLIEEPRAKAFFNEVNSGSPFVQWKKGIKLASGKYIWIAESDDLAAPRFLSELVRRLESDAGFFLATSQLYMIDKKGKILGKPIEWRSEFHSKRWDSDYINNGIDEIENFLSKKNTILNASGVVMRNFEGLSEMVDSNMRFCADWLLWVRLLEKGNIAYMAEPLNFWRIDSGNARIGEIGEIERKETPFVLKEIERILTTNVSI